MQKQLQSSKTGKFGKCDLWSSLAQPAYWLSHREVAEVQGNALHATYSRQHKLQYVSCICNTLWLVMCANGYRSWQIYRGSDCGGNIQSTDLHQIFTDVADCQSANCQSCLLEQDADCTMQVDLPPDCGSEVSCGHAACGMQHTRKDVQCAGLTCLGAGVLQAGRLAS